MNTKSRIFHETGAAERFEKLEKQTTPKTYEMGVDFQKEKDVGMSNSYRIAIEEGANIIRIGS